MIKIKFFLILILSFLIRDYSYSFLIDDLKFSEIIKENDSKTKEFILTNNTNIKKVYELKIEGDNEVKVFPNILNIEPLSNKKFIIKVAANKLKGKHKYFLVIKEKNRNPKEEGIELHKTIRIQHEYTIK